MSTTNPDRPLVVTAEYLADKHGNQIAKKGDPVPDSVSKKAREALLKQGDVAEKSDDKPAVKESK